MHFTVACPRGETTAEIGNADFQQVFHHLLGFVF